jgi:mRNA interferase RelE/StbE
MGPDLMYRIELKKQAKKFMDKLPPPERKRIVHEIERLPDGKSLDIKPLKGHPGLLRLRVGDYRIIYTVDHGKWIVLVIDIGNRGQIYRRY